MMRTRVSIDSPVLANLLSESLLPTGDRDGLLLGLSDFVTSSQLSDDGAAHPCLACVSWRLYDAAAAASQSRRWSKSVSCESTATC